MYTNVHNILEVDGTNHMLHNTQDPVCRHFVSLDFRIDGLQ